ncbi:hypothetical protein PanWU01x14_154970 [Parasponia andersonii]|uniref:Uncharacterized protein n=1 Tax=Parasponia andersonii TaxID=3476 RepID=A0A2P5CGK9_PARAD|nr:hypothetical protein PanWU01x14_154970 [Parasponia andersonii]
MSKLASGGKSELCAEADSIDGIRVRMNEMKTTQLSEIELELDSFEQASARVDDIDWSYVSEPKEDDVNEMKRLRVLNCFDVDERKMTVSE